MITIAVLALAVGSLFLARLGRYGGAVAALLVLMYSRISETPDARGALTGIASLAILGVAFIIFVVRTSQGGSRGVGTMRGFWSASLLYLAVLYGSSLWAPDAHVAIAQGNTLAKDLVVVYLIVEGLTTFRAQRLAAWTLIAVAALIAGLTVMQAVTHTYSHSYFGLAQTHVAFIVGQTDGYRSGGPVGDPNFFGLALAAVIPLALLRLRDESSTALRLCAAGAAALMLGGILLSYSRTAIVAVVVTTGLLALLSAIPLRRVAITALVVLPLTFFVPHLWHRAASITSNDQSIQGRTASDRVSLSIFAAHPLVGVGADNYHTTYIPYATRLQVVDAVPYAHDLYLATASETGAVGLASFGAAIGAVLIASWRSRRALLAAARRTQEGLVTGAGLALICYLVGSLFLPNAYPRYLWMLVGLAIATSRPYGVDD